MAPELFNNHHSKDSQSMRHARKLIHIAPTLAFMLTGADAIACGISWDYCLWACAAVHSRPVWINARGSRIVVCSLGFPCAPRSLCQ